MSAFQFCFSARGGDLASQEVYEFPAVLAAIKEAKRILAEMALDRFQKPLARR